MSEEKVKGAGLRRRVGSLLQSDDFDDRLSELSQFPERQVINPLFSFIYSPDELIKGRAVTAMGRVMARMADQDMESARNIMRRFIWNLNDESGCSGWGSAEAMGEIMAAHERLAEEYYRILISYIAEDGNPLENDMLERGVLWGIGRLAQVRPHLLRNAVPHLLPYLKSLDPVQRGFAVWALGFLKNPETRDHIEPLLNDLTEITIFVDGKVERCRLCDLAAQALDRIG
ncbi:DVU0298 family protein [Desulforhabdus amnigena]|uniref:HEAT repeat domain-containing protein n=1 Tax=Desulforhabdus amnigena TaxID=40218 RepID=A0A9W6FWS4_9BACT|nr:DVU0298 family protein [Desulforhabdus amnigena]NLJ29867.1 HEAT repeat domain-containing protein [Deltaproteobacteria bacterium]GLI36262.1 hypothetical protein DAMNIGENAA_36950 [Desulforhabdus amnigena]